ncbi:MAG: RluA family pseudouridine synthase [Acidimicrobiales bacterium]|jgi:23S rRNA pseudouridine1911/1915/1917 synthase|nr:RluA family pseudouridine synthase [Acidimicrobiales bacterium]
MRPRLDETIPEALAGERVDRVVALLGDMSRSAVARLVDNGSIRLDRAVIRSASRRVEVGERLEVELPEAVDPRPAPDDSVDFAVRHEDEHILVVEKPAGLVVHPGAGNEAGTLVNGLVARYPDIADVGDVHRPGIVHRLDRGTSGLLVVARTAAAYEELVRQMSAHEPERIYTALTWGHPENDGGVIDAPIGRSPRHPTRMAVSQHGRDAVTHYAVDQRFDEPRETALLTCRLETGRTHQIRVHLRAIGHPVVGDRDYDGGRPGLDPGRPFLHAGELRVVHPATGEEVRVVAELPDDLQACLRECR